MTEPDLSRVEWRKSSFSGTENNCVEVAVVDAIVSVHRAGGERLYVLRDSKDPAGAKLYFTPSEFRAFIAGAKCGEFD